MSTSCDELPPDEPGSPLADQPQGEGAPPPTPPAAAPEPAAEKSAKRRSSGESRASSIEHRRPSVDSALPLAKDRFDW